MRTPRPPLSAGPVRVDGSYARQPADRRDVEEIRLAIVAAAALRYLARDRDHPW